MTRKVLVYIIMTFQIHVMNFTCLLDFLINKNHVYNDFRSLDKTVHSLSFPNKLHVQGEKYRTLEAESTSALLRVLLTDVDI